MRFSLRWLFVAILLIAISIVAVLNANEYWVWALRSTLLAALLFSIALAIVSRRETRPFWIAFAVVGSGYFLSGMLDHWPPFDVAESDDVVRWFHAKAIRYREVDPSNLPPEVVEVRDGKLTMAISPFAHFRVALHCAVTMWLALAGGFVAMSFYRRNTHP